MGKPGKKASNIFQNPGIKNNNGVKLPFIKGIGSPLKYGKSPMQFNATLKKAAVDGKLDDNPKFKAAVESSPAKMYKSSPAKGYKSAAQRKAVHASKADGGAGHPDKKKSPAKKYGHKSPAKKYATSKSSPMKKSTVKVKDLPKEAAKLGKKGIDAVKKLGSKIGNITVSNPEKQALKKKQKAERKALKAKQKQEKKSPAKKYKKSPAKKHCSPAKQAKSKKQMRYEKISQKAENAVKDDKMNKNSRLVDKANKYNERNKLGNKKIAKG